MEHLTHLTEQDRSQLDKWISGKVTHDLQTQVLLITGGADKIQLASYLADIVPNCTWMIYNQDLDQVECLYMWADKAKASQNENLKLVIVCSSPLIHGAARHYAIQYISRHRINLEPERVSL